MGSLLFILSQGELPNSWKEKNQQETAIVPENPTDEALVMYIDDATTIVSDLDINSLLTRTQERPSEQWHGCGPTQIKMSTDLLQGT